VRGNHDQGKPVPPLFPALQVYADDPGPAALLGR
jgi:hypothetical protein